MKIKVRQANKQECKCCAKREAELAKKEQEEREFRQKVRNGEKRDSIICSIILLLLEGGVIYGSVDWMINKDFLTGLVTLVGGSVVIIFGIFTMIRIYISGLSEF